MDHTKEVAVASTGDLAERVHRDPEQVRAELLAWLPDAPPDEVVATRGQLVDIDAHVRRHQPAVLREVRRMARLTEWEMARRWPAKGGGRDGRDDDRPTIGGTDDTNRTAWKRIYAVGRADRDWLLGETQPGMLTQASVIRYARQDDSPDFIDPPPLAVDGGLFDVIYADPPWDYANKPKTREGKPRTDLRGDAAKHYPTMTLDDICALPVPAADDCVLYLWATAPLLPEAMRVIDAWGFTYKTCAVWDKEKVGVGYWFRGQHELLLVGVRGNVQPPEQRLRVPSVYREARTRHSRKPDHIRTLIASWFPNANRLEMFGRKPVPGWEVWSNQVGSSLAHLPVEMWDPDDPSVTGQHSLLDDEVVA